MKTYRNKKTGNIIHIESTIISDTWEEVAEKETKKQKKVEKKE